MRIRILSILLACLSPALGACNEPLDFSTAIPTGRLVVEVTDTSNAPVPNVPVTLRLLNDSSVWRTTQTGTDGRAEVGAEDGGVLTGDYLVQVTPPAGYRIPPAATHPVPLRIVTDSTVTLRVTLIDSRREGLQHSNNLYRQFVSASLAADQHDGTDQALPVSTTNKILDRS